MCGVSILAFYAYVLVRQSNLSVYLGLVRNAPHFVLHNFARRTTLVCTLVLALSGAAFPG